MLRFFHNDKRDVLKYHTNFKIKKSANPVICEIQGYFK